MMTLIIFFKFALEESRISVNTLLILKLYLYNYKLASVIFLSITILNDYKIHDKL